MNFDNLEINVKLQNQKNVFGKPTAILIYSFLFILFLNYCLPIFIANKILNIVLFYGSCCGLIISLLYFGFSVRKNKQSIAKTAFLIDKSTHSKNRLEAALELKKSDNPYREDQASQTIDFYSNYKKPRWKFERNLRITFIVLLMISILLKLNYNLYEVKLCGTKQKIVNNIDNKDDKLIVIPDFANLNLVKPDPELRARPLDIIKWAGIGEASKTFNEISLDFSINGVYKTNFPVTNFKKQKKEINFDGEFLLKSLDVEPFDVVSYYLKGKANNNDKEVISVPQFIEVRPFKDIVHVIMGSSMPKKKKKQLKDIVSMINEFLACQISLNKAVYSLRGADINDTNIFRQQIDIIADEQKMLENELSRFINEFSTNGLSTNMVKSLLTAAESMKKSTRELK